MGVNYQQRIITTRYTHEGFCEKGQEWTCLKISKIPILFVSQVLMQMCFSLRENDLFLPNFLTPL